MSYTPSNRNEAHFRILRILKENPDLTQREIARQLGMSLGAVNYCLRALVDKGLIKIQNFRKSNNKAGYAYLLTSSGIREKMALTESFLKRKLEEYEALKVEIESLKQDVASLPSNFAKNDKS